MGSTCRYLFLIAALGLAACGDHQTEQHGNQPLERQLLVQSGGAEYQFDYPFVFGWGTWVQLDELEQGEILVCVAVKGMGDCINAGARQGDIWSVELIPYCQGDGRLVLKFQVLRDPDPQIDVFFVDGAVTLDSELANRWIGTDPTCSFDQTPEAQ